MIVHLLGNKAFSRGFHSVIQLPTKRPHHQPLKQPLDRHSRRILLLAEGFDTLHDPGELRLDMEGMK